MTKQEMVERDVRMALGELTLQVIMLRAEVQEAQQQLAEMRQHPEPAPKTKSNGEAKEASPI